MMLSAVLGGSAPQDPCVLARDARAAQAHVRLFAPDGRFARPPQRLAQPPFGIAEALDGVAADRAGNDRHELTFEVQGCEADGQSVRIAGWVHHGGWSNEPATGEAYPAAYAAPFAETWRLEGGGWVIETLQIGEFAKRGGR